MVWGTVVGVREIVGGGSRHRTLPWVRGVVVSSVLLIMRRGVKRWESDGALGQVPMTAPGNHVTRLYRELGLGRS